MVKRFWKFALIFLVVWCIANVLVAALDLLPPKHLRQATFVTLGVYFILLISVYAYYMYRIISTMAKPYSKENFEPNMIQMKQLRSLLLSMFCFIFVFIGSNLATWGLYHFFAN